MKHLAGAFVLLLALAGCAPSDAEYAWCADHVDAVQALYGGETLAISNEALHRYFVNRDPALQNYSPDLTADERTAADVACSKAYAAR